MRVTMSDPGVIISGTPARLYTSKPYTSLDGVVTNPDQVVVKWQVQGQPETTYTWTNPTGDPEEMISNYALGLFRITIPTVGLVGWCIWGAYAFALGGPDPEQIQVLKEGKFLISERSLA